MSESISVTYIQIADFPGSIYRVGDEIKVYRTSGKAYVVECGECTESYDIREFPHLYKEIVCSASNDVSASVTSC